MAEPRHVVVTGAAAGIGLAIARQLAGQGFAVGLIDQSPGVEAVADDIACSTGAPMAWALADLADAAQIPPALATLQAALGPAAGLVNNAASPATSPRWCACRPTCGRVNWPST